MTTATKHAKARAAVAAKRAQARAARPASNPAAPRQAPPPASPRYARPAALATAPPRFISYQQPRERYGETRSRTQLRRDIIDKKYPAPKQISAQRIAWDTFLLDRHYDACPTVHYTEGGEAA